MTKAKAATPTLFEAPAEAKTGEVLPAAKAPAAKAKTTAVAVREPEQPLSMLGIIAKAAASPLVDVAKMRELLAMQREIEQREEVRAFNTAMLSAQSAMPKLLRDKPNKHTGVSYPSLENVSKSIDPIVRSNGFTMSWGSADSPLPKHYRVVCDLAHTGGHEKRYFLDLESDTAGPKGIANKTPVQGVSSSISYGRRVLKILIFDLVVEGSDQDGNAPKVKTEVEALSMEQAAQIRARALEVNCTIEYLLEYLNRTRGRHPVIEAITDLPATAFGKVMELLTTYKKHNPAPATEQA